MYDIAYDHIHTFRQSNMAIEIPELGKGISWDFPLPRLTTGG